jgi:hypothetical protein
MKIRPPHLLRCERAQAVTEFAITIPFFILFSLGLVQTVMIVNGRYMVSYSAFQAARTGMLFEMNSALPKGTNSEKDEFLTRQRILMARAALVCLTPLRYRTDDPAALALGIALAHTENALSISLPNPPGLPNLNPPSDIGQIPNFISNITSALAGIANYANQVGAQVSGFLNNLEGLSQGFPSNKFIEVRRLAAPDSDQDFQVAAYPSEQLTVEITHKFLLEIPVVNRILFLGITFVDPQTGLNTPEDELYFDMKERYTISVPQLAYQSGNLSYW